MLKFFAKIFGYLLNFIYSYVNNYGLAIILFSIILKIVMLPLSIKQQKALKKNAEMQVKVKEIQEKYSNDQTRQSQELMDLYKRENVSPFSGCLGSIVQLIIVLSMFYLVSSPLTYMKNVDESVINQYVEEITEETQTQVRYREIAVIKEKGATDPRVYLNMDFLGLNLGDIPSQNYKDFKVLIIPILYVLTSFLSMKLTNSLNKTKKEEKTQNVVTNENSSEVSLVPKENKEDDAMEEMQKQMNMMMPLMTVSIALIAPLGLALYWLVNNIMMILERVIINKFFKEGEEK